MKTVYLALLLVLGGSGVARGDRSSDARTHYDNATAAFAVGDFAEAAIEYQAAFKLKHDPALLYNAAQAHRLAGNHEKALILYRNYLQLYPNEKNLDEVRTQIAKLKDAVAAVDKAKTSPPTTTAEPRPLSPGTVEPTPPAAHLEPTVTPTETPSPIVATPQKDKPLYKKWWLWTIVGGVLVAGGAVAVAVVLTRPGSWSSTPDVLGPGVMNHGLVQW